MELQFYKYQGTGNDFILIDLRGLDFIIGKETISWLCNRRFGIGSDGLIILKDAPGYEFRMVYYNSDGLEGTMCGNGGRCAIAFTDYLSPTTGVVNFNASDGEHSGVVINRENGQHEIRLKMSDTDVWKDWGGDFVMNTGSPHLVRFVNDIGCIDVVGLGNKLRNHSDFQPDGINVNFVEIKGSNLFVRTYERGVEDETLSCGTGVTAAALVHASKEKINSGQIRVSTLGGNLNVYFKNNGTSFTDIWLEGPAVKVFEGRIDVLYGLSA